MKKFNKIQTVSIQNQGEEMSELELDGVTGGALAKTKLVLGLGDQGGCFCSCGAGPGRHKPNCPYNDPNSPIDDTPMFQGA